LPVDGAGYRQHDEQHRGSHNHPPPRRNAEPYGQKQGRTDEKERKPFNPAHPSGLVDLACPQPFNSRSDLLYDIRFTEIQNLATNFVDNRSQNLGVGTGDHGLAIRISLVVDGAVFRRFRDRAASFGAGHHREYTNARIAQRSRSTLNVTLQVFAIGHEEQYTALALLG
jgi:hypothetical protein